MSKKLTCIFVLFGTFFLSCTTVKQPITFQKEIGFHYDCTGLAPDCIHVEIKRGFALGEEEIYIETHQGYVKSGVVHWQGKTTDKNGDELPLVEFYEIDSTYYENLQYTDKFHESYRGHFLGTSDEHGIFNIRNRTKSCQGFFVNQPGYLGTIYYLRQK